MLTLGSICELDLYRFLYSVFFYLAIPFVLLRLLIRSVREPGYRQDLLQRFGFFRSAAPGRLIWVHAVSAGETVAAVPLVKKLLAAGHPCLVTNMTPTGRGRVRALLGGQVENAYAPYDLPGSVNRFLRRNKPRLLITIDTELWPNILAACKKQAIKTALVNGRMSSRSAAAYSRLPKLSRTTLASIDLIAVQTREHAQRFAGLGANPARIAVTGSIKFDGEFPGGFASSLEQARQLTGGRPVLLGASTHAGEEEALLRVMPALQSQVRDILLVLAPRHTHRCGRVTRLCERMGYPARLFSLSEDGPGLDDSVLILDEMGRLESFFPVARLAFIGGSLVPVGGHNFLEAVRAGTAVLMGPHLDNIEDIAGQFIDRDAMRLVRNQDELSKEVIELMTNEGRVRGLVESANQVLAANQGSLGRVVDLLAPLLSPPSITDKVR